MSKSQKISNLPNAPAFSAYGSALQSVADQTYTKIAYNTEEFDTASCFNTSTYRFTPNVAGYYKLSATLSSASSANGAVWVVRQVERQVAIPADVATKRLAIVAECGRLETAISGCATVEELISVVSAQNWTQE